MSMKTKRGIELETGDTVVIREREFTLTEIHINGRLSRVWKTDATADPEPSLKGTRLENYRAPIQVEIQNDQDVTVIEREEKP